MKKPRTALIGCGRIGYLLENDPLRYKPCTHYGGLKAAGLRINCACDINPGRLEEFAKTAGISPEKTSTDYRELLLNEKPDLVIIATWTDSHAEIGIFAANNGAKVIICEKPITSNLDHAKSLIEECEKNNAVLIINHERRYDTKYLAAKRLIESRKIGEIKSIQASILTPARVLKSKSEYGGGPLLHDGTHMIDIIRYLAGDIYCVTGELEKEKSSFEHRAVAWMKTVNGVDIFLEAGGRRDYFMFDLQIYGTAGKIVIGNGYNKLFVSKKSEFYTGFRDLKEIPFPMSGIKNINYFKREYTEAKNILAGRSKKISSGGYDGYKALEVIHAVYLSSYLKSKKIILPVNPGKINLRKIFGI
ncbi:MAG: Gfo/Idh/MocA family oxidoreductase [Spirochaetes bacterium]|nr:Gfo/Idh/MocA family oxidoreductase [Spirochaetota bacterium]